MSRPITPLLAVDAVIQIINKPNKPIVLIERLNPPFGWALPGGFVEIGESTEQAVCREAKEETGLDINLVGLVGVYSDPKRDPRGHCVSVVYAAQSTGEPIAADDAKNVQLFTFDNLPSDLAFDHAKILMDYKNQLG
jgi:8-oxo-dGTP diphosphatase